MNKKSKIYLIISILSLIVVIGALAAIGGLLWSYEQAKREYEALALAARATSPTVEAAPTEAPPETTTGEDPTEPPVDIPINFDYLEAQNPDIIGWITVEGTVIDYPILYDDTWNLYYLNRNYLGTSTSSGSIFVLSDNGPDFNDFNTLVYGHNMRNGQMFAALHDFRDPDFFRDHGEVIVYTPDRKLTYQVFAAYRTDNLNILRNNDFSTMDARQAYVDGIFEKTDLAQFKQEYPVTGEDRILTLSTCIGNHDYRFLVQCVLVSEEAGVFGGNS